MTIENDRGFIYDFEKLILSAHPTNELWARSISINALDAALTYDTFVRTELGPLRLANHFLMIGPSGLANKSSPMMNMLIPLLSMFEELADKEIFLPSRFSVEGMIEYLAKTGTKSGSLIRDEFSSMIKDINSKKYMAEGLEFMSEMMDGYIHKRYTRSTKTQHPRNVFVNIISATTDYIYEKIDIAFFMQGTGNKFMYIFEDAVKAKKIKPESLIFTNLPDHQEELQDLAYRLFKLHQNLPQRIGFEEGKANKMITDFWNKNYVISRKRYEEDRHDPIYQYLVRLHEKAIKLAALHAISYNIDYFGEDGNDFNQMLLIRESDVVWSLRSIKRYYSSFLNLLNAWQASAEMKPVISEKKEFDYVLSKLRDLGGEEQHTVFRKELGWSDAKKFNNIIRLLIDNGDIMVFNRKSKSGRKATWYRLLKKKQEAKSK